MKTYTAFEMDFLVASYLTAEDAGETMVGVEEVLNRYSLDPKPNWIMRALTSFTSQGFTIGKLHFGPEMSQRVYLSPSGVKEAERLITHGIVTLTQAASISSDQPTDGIDSAAWTGKYHVSEAGIGEITRILTRIESEVDISSLSNSDKSNAKALLQGAEKLIEAPDPEWSIILAILSSPILANFAAIAVLAISIIKP